jgi:hypothetical protein
MPEENGSRGIPDKPDAEPPSQVPAQATAKDGIPSQSAQQYAQPIPNVTIQNLEKDVRTAEVALIILGILTLAVNIYIAHIYYGQLQQMKIATQSTKDAVQVARDTLNATISSNTTQALLTEKARTSAEAASQKVLDTTVEASRLDQRAWVGFGDPTFVLNLTDPAKVEVRVNVLGKSPATEIKTRVATVTEPSQHYLQPSDLVYPDSLYEMTSGTAFPGQGFPRSANGADPITEQDKAMMQSLLDGTNTLYFFGYVTYKDIFKRPHWTHFCDVVDKKLKSASPCPFYNDSDADQPKKNP